MGGAPLSTVVAQAVAAAAALTAAEDLGVLAALGQGPVEPLRLADRLALGREGTVRLLQALAGLGIVREVDKGWLAVPPCPEELTRLLIAWRGLTEAVRRGRPAGEPPSGEVLQPTFLTAPAAAQVAELLADTVGEAPQVLHVAAGGAVWSLALAARRPLCRVTAVELPAALPATRRAVEAAGRSAQFTYREGGPESGDWGPDGSYDLALSVGLCSLLDAGGARRLLRRLHRALRPGGTLALVEVLGDEGTSPSVAAALHALELLLRSVAGRDAPFSTYAGWLHQEGFELLIPHALEGRAPLTLLTARRPR